MIEKIMFSTKISFKLGKNRHKSDFLDTKWHIFLFLLKLQTEIWKILFKHFVPKFYTLYKSDLIWNHFKISDLGFDLRSIFGEDWRFDWKSFKKWFCNNLIFLSAAWVHQRQSTEVASGPRSSRSTSSRNCRIGRLLGYHREEPEET